MIEIQQNLVPQNALIRTQNKNRDEESLKVFNEVLLHS